MTRKENEPNNGLVELNGFYLEYLADGDAVSRAKALLEQATTEEDRKYHQKCIAGLSLLEGERLKVMARWSANEEYYLRELSVWKTLYINDCIVMIVLILAQVLIR